MRSIAPLTIQISRNKPIGIKYIQGNVRPVSDQLEIVNKFDYFYINLGPSLTKMCLQLKFITIDNI